MAMELGVHPETLTIHAHRHNWAQQRATVQAQKAVLEKGSRAQIAAQVDAEMTRRVQSIGQKMAEHLEKMADKVASLSITGETERDTRQLIKSSVELTQGVVKGLAELVETGRSVGLVLGPVKTEGEKAKMDFSKLTTLNFILKEAQKPQGMAKAKQAETIDLPAEPMESF